MINAAAPITGGMICPADDAELSTPPAKEALYPVSFISGIVKEPVVTTFASDDPEIVPRNPDATTAVFAGPPTYLPVSEKARSINCLAPPVASRNEPNKINAKTKVVATDIGVPSIPSRVMYIWEATRSTPYPLWPSIPGRYEPRKA